MAEDAVRQDDVVRRREFTLFLRIAAGVATVVVGAAGLVFLQLLEVNRTMAEGDATLRDTMAEGDATLRDAIYRRIAEDAQEEIIGRIDESDEEWKSIINRLIEEIEQVKADTTSTLERVGTIEAIIEARWGSQLERLPEARE